MAVMMLTAGSHAFAQQLALDPEVRHGKLDNGFTYFIRKTDQAAGKASMRLVVKAGWQHEDADQIGLAHLLEHVAFNGTKHFPNETLMEYFNSVGFTPGNNWNATTGDITNYFVDFPSSNAELFSNCLQIMRDWAQDMQLDPKEIDAERGVVLSEMRDNNSAAERLQKAAQAKQLNHPMYPVNWKEQHDHVINNFKHEAIIRFYKDWYRPDLQALMIAGDIDVDETEKKVRKMFADLKMPEHPRNADPLVSRFIVPIEGKGRFVTMSAKSATNITIKIMQRRKAVPTEVKTVEDVRHSILVRMYDNLIYQRLNEIRESDNKPFDQVQHRINPNYFGYYGGTDVLYSEMTLNPRQSIAEGMKTMSAELNRIAVDGFTAEELRQIKDKMLKDDEDNFVHLFSPASLAGRYEDHFVKGVTAMSPQQEHDLKKKILQQITLDEISGFARSWIHADQYTDIVILAPDNMKLPTQAQATQWIAAGKKVKLPPYKAPAIPTGNFLKQEDLPVVDKNAAIKNIIKKDEVGATEVFFTNGMRLLLKPHKIDDGHSDEIMVTGIRPGGASAYGEEDYFNATHTAMLGAANSGIGEYSGRQMKKFMYDRDLRAGVYISEYATEINGSAKRDDVEMMLQLLYLQMTAPSKNKAAFDSWMNKTRKELQQKQQTRNIYTFYDSAVSLLYNGNAPYKQPGLEDLGKISFDRLAVIHREQFSSLDGFTMIVTGDFDPEQMTGLFVKYFGGFKPGNVETVKPAMGTHEFSGDVNRTFYIGDEEGASVVLHFPGKYTPALKEDVLHEILGQVWKMKILNRLREQEGGAYAPSASNSFGKMLGGNYDYSATFSCAVDNVEHMISAARDELQKLQQHGVDEEAFRKARQRVKEDFQAKLQGHRFWPEYLKGQIICGQDEVDILKIIGLYEIVTADDVSKAAKKYLSDEHMTRFVKMPERSRK